MAVAGGIGPALAAENAAEGQVRVLLASGRHFTAEMDRRTDASTLWLRWSEGTGVILRPIDWDRVVEMRIAGETFSGHVARQAVIFVRQEFPLAVNPPRPTPPPPGLAASAVGDARNATSGATRPDSDRGMGRPAVGGNRESSRRVRTLSVDACLGKWGPTVDADGLVVEISPLDEQGEIVPVQGTVEVELIAQGPGMMGSGEFATPGHWVQSVWPGDFSYRGARCRLPFQAVQPEFDLRWASKGIVHVRLSVPGEGVFEASAAMTRIRPFSEVRDNYQETTGQRFLPNERTSRPTTSH